MNKRSNGEGCFRKLKSGTWRGQIMDGYRADGKRNIVSFTAPTKSEVQQKIRRYLADTAAGLTTLSRSMSFSVWAEQWYQDYVTQVQPSTYSSYRYTLKLLKAFFDYMVLSEIKPQHINSFMTKLLKEGCSLSKISKCRSMLIQIFDAAENNGLILKNPARKAKAIRTQSTEDTGKDAFSYEEVALLKKYLRNDLLGNSIRLLLGSGLRVQELLALRPEDIAEDGSEICVNKAIKMVDGKPTIGPPKSKRSCRTVPIPEDYRPYAVYLRTHGGKSYIWTSTRKSLLYSVGTFRNKYYAALKRVPGIRKLGPHCCRHTYVTHLEAHQVPLAEIARLVGHSTVSTTNRYLHISSDTLERAVSTLNCSNRGSRNLPAEAKRMKGA